LFSDEFLHFKQLSFEIIVYTQADLHSFAVSADATVVFFISDKTQLVKWLVKDSDVAAIIDLSASLSAFTDEGNAVDRQKLLPALYWQKTN